MDKDLQQLRMLSIAHLVVAGLTALLSCFALVYVLIGIVFVVQPPPPQGDMPPWVPGMMGTIFILTGVVYLLVGWTMAIGLYVAGRSLERRKRYLFCMIVAAVNCIFFPIGTTLGVLTILVLSRPSVKLLFEMQANPDAARIDVSVVDVDDRVTT